LGRRTNGKSSRISFSHNDQKSNMQNLKWAGVVAVGVTFALCAVMAHAQQPKTYRIGVLLSGSPDSNASRIAALRDGLRELGYDEGQNLAVDYRFAEGKVDRFPSLAAELVSLKPHVLVTSGSAGIRALMKSTASIPIVMAQDTDPVGNGFVASLAPPGGNITGLSSYSAELNGKRLELLKEIVPKLSRLAVVGESTYPGNAQSLKEAELPAAAFGVKVQYVDILGPKDFEPVFRAAADGRAEAVLVLQSAVLNSRRKQFADLAIKSGLPAVYYAAEWMEAGGLMSFAASITDLYRRAALYVDKILKGAKPGELPVEQPTKFELVINLKTAKQIRLTISPSVLARADRVIK
jgi:putative ABC transport system substrate-binding protein